MWKHNLSLAFRHLKRQKAYSLLNIFGFSVSISCFLLHLLALITFIAQQRMKEIGVRKILGATMNGILLLLSKDILGRINPVLILKLE